MTHAQIVAVRGMLRAIAELAVAAAAAMEEPDEKPDEGIRPRPRYLGDTGDGHEQG